MTRLASGVFLYILQDANVRKKGGGGLVTSGQCVCVRKQVFSADVLYGQPLNVFFYARE